MTRGSHKVGLAITWRSIQSLLSVTHRFGVVALAVMSTALFLLPANASAFFSAGCIANITPSTMDVGTAQDFNISLTNASFDTVQWVDFNVPSAAYTYAGNSITDWSTADHDGGTTATGASLDGQQTQDFLITAVAGLQGTSPENWHIETSTDPSGANPITCTGQLATSIIGHLPQTNVNGVSNIAVSNVTYESATISWQSDNPSTTLVYYGLTSNYGDTSSFDGGYNSSHVVSLTGLKASTTYHFQVVGTDTNGNYAYSIDNTFVTPARPVTPPATNPKPITKVQTTSPSESKDGIAPQLQVVTKLTGAYKQAPLISGTASDNKGVATVEYSTDNGVNWLPVDTLDAQGKPTVTFSFTPRMSIDGNYITVVRAFDTSGNVTQSAAQTLILDRLPPTVGGMVTSLGAQTLKPDGTGLVRALVGNDQKITLSAIGGATSIVVDATQTSRKNVTQSFSLTRSADTGLWSGVLNFQYPGTFQLSVRALDGAGNATKRDLSTVVAQQPSSIVDSATHKPVQSSLDVYYRDPETNTWVRWDAASYSQSNPVRTTATGQYGLYLPGGTYYLRAYAPGYVSMLTKSFTLSEPTIVSTALRLRHKPVLNLGPIHITLPWFSLDQTSVGEARASIANKTSSYEGKALDGFALPQSDGQTLTLTSLYGKPTVMTFVSTWAPSSQDQLSSLAQLTSDGYNVVVVDSGENIARVKAYYAIAGFSRAVTIDSDNKLIGNLGVSGLPSTYFIDRHGVVKKIMVGVLSKEELQRNVSTGL